MKFNIKQKINELFKYLYKEESKCDRYIYLDFIYYIAIITVFSLIVAIVGSYNHIENPSILLVGTSGMVAILLGIKTIEKYMPKRVGIIIPTCTHVFGLLALGIYYFKDIVIFKYISDFLFIVAYVSLIFFGISYAILSIFGDRWFKNKKESG